MRSRRRMRMGLKSVAMLAGCIAFLACSGEQYEKPAKEEAEEKPAVEAPAAPPAAKEAAPAPKEPEVPAAAPTEAEEPEPTPTTEAAAEEPAEEEAEPAAEAEPAGEETESSGDLVLLGVVQAGRTPSALIEYQGSQESFQKGDSVFGQGTLSEVREDSVVLQTEDGKVTLKLPATEAEAPPPTPEPAVVEATKPAEAEAAPPPVTQSISRSEAQNALMKFSEVLEKANAERISVGGGHGIRLGDVDPKSFLAKVGLKSGDILQKINGISLNDPAKLPDLSGAATGGELEITFVRDEIGLTFAKKLR